jgi:hypothetical protein
MLSCNQMMAATYKLLRSRGVKFRSASGVVWKVGGPPGQTGKAVPPHFSNTLSKEQPYGVKADFEDLYGNVFSLPEPRPTKR